MHNIPLSEPFVSIQNDRSIPNFKDCNLFKTNEINTNGTCEQLCICLKLPRDDNVISKLNHAKAH